MALTPRPQTAVFVLTDNDGRQYGVDITTRQKLSDRYIVTKHPVEEGAEVADHIQKSEATLEIAGEVTNTPLHLTEDVDPRRAITSYELLRRIADQKRTVSLATAVRSYSELAFTELVVERGSDVSAETVRLSMSLIEIIRAKARTATLDPSLFADDARDSASDVADSGGATEPSRPCQQAADRDFINTLAAYATGTDLDEYDQCRTELGQGPQPDHAATTVDTTGRPLSNMDVRIDYETSLDRRLRAEGLQIVPGSQ